MHNILHIINKRKRRIFEKLTFHYGQPSLPRYPTPRYRLAQPQEQPRACKSQHKLSTRAAHEQHFFPLPSDAPSISDPAKECPFLPPWNEGEKNGARFRAAYTRGAFRSTGWIQKRDRPPGRLRSTRSHEPGDTPPVLSKGPNEQSSRGRVSWFSGLISAGMGALNDSTEGSEKAFRNCWKECLLIQLGFQMRGFIRNYSKFQTASSHFYIPWKRKEERGKNRDRLKSRVAYPIMRKLSHTNNLPRS